MDKTEGPAETHINNYMVNVDNLEELKEVVDRLIKVQNKNQQILDNIRKSSKSVYVCTGFIFVGVITNAILYFVL